MVALSLYLRGTKCCASSTTINKKQPQQQKKMCYFLLGVSNKRKIKGALSRRESFITQQRLRLFLTFNWHSGWPKRLLCWVQPHFSHKVFIENNFIKQRGRCSQLLWQLTVFISNTRSLLRFLPFVCQSAGVPIKGLLWTGNNRRASWSRFSRQQQEMIMKERIGLHPAVHSSLRSSPGRSCADAAGALSHPAGRKQHGQQEAAGTSCPCVYCCNASKSAAHGKLQTKKKSCCIVQLVQCSEQMSFALKRTQDSCKWIHCVLFAWRWQCETATATLKVCYTVRQQSGWQQQLFFLYWFFFFPEVRSGGIQNSNQQFRFSFLGGKQASF